MTMFDDHGDLPQTSPDKIDNEKQAQLGNQLTIWV